MHIDIEVKGISGEAMAMLVPLFVPIFVTSLVVGALLCRAAASPTPMPEKAKSREEGWDHVA